MIPAVGYADANQSHFTSRHYWEVGEVNPFGRIGWLGRYLDKHGVDDNPLQGLSLDWNLAPALAAADKPVAAVSSPENFSLDARDVWDATIRTRLVEGLSAQGSLATDDPELRAARVAATQTVGLRDQLAPLQRDQRAVADRGHLPEQQRLRPAAGGAGRDARPAACR